MFVFYWLQVVKARQENYAAAKEYARQRFEIMGKLVSANNLDYLVVKSDWARYRALAGETDQAAVQIGELMPLIHKSFPSPSFSAWTTYRNSSNVMNLAGRFPEAESFAREALAAVDAAHLGEIDARRAESLFALGTALRKEKKFQDARLNLEHAVNIYSQCGPTFAKTLARARKLLSETPSR